MKKFQFSLAKLLSYKEQVLQKEKNALAELRRQLLELQEEKEQMIILCNAKSEQLYISSRSGLTAIEIAVQKTFITTLQDNIHLKEKEIELMELRVEKQLYVVIEATKEVSTLEKLKETQLEEYKKKEQKEHELFIEEFVSNKTARLDLS